MKTTSKIIDKALQTGLKIGGVGNFFKVYEKDERGVPQPNGPHRIKLLRDEAKLGKDPQTGIQRQELVVYVEENGEEKIWNIPVLAKKNDNTYDSNTINYLVGRLNEFKEGDVIIVEGKRKGMRLHTEITRAEQDKPQPSMSDEDVPVEDIIIDF